MKFFRQKQAQCISFGKILNIELCLRINIKERMHRSIACKSRLFLQQLLSLFQTKICLASVYTTNQDLPCKRLDFKPRFVSHPSLLQTSTTSDGLLQTKVILTGFSSTQDTSTSIFNSTHTLHRPMFFSLPGMFKI